MPLHEQTYLRDLTQAQFDLELTSRIEAAKLVNVAIIDVTNDRGKHNNTFTVSFQERLTFVAILMSVKWHMLNPDNRIIHPAGISTTLWLDENRRQNNV